MALSKTDIKKVYDEPDQKEMGFLNKIKMLFLHPARFFESVKDENLKPAFMVFLVFFLISAGIRLVLQLLLPTALSAGMLWPLIGSGVSFSRTLFIIS